MNSLREEQARKYGRATEVMNAWNGLLARSTVAHSGRRIRLSRFSRILALYQSDFGCLPRIVKITGTSGKGSLCAILESMFLRDGSRVLTFTSPHLINPNERIRLDGLAISDEVLNNASERAMPFFDKILDTLGNDFQPSYFETLLLLALHIARDCMVDLILLEVAVGGYNDVVSLFPSPLAAITTVGLDHRNELGESIHEIAADKAGIASNGSTLILGPSIIDSAKSAIFSDVLRRGIEVVQADRGRIVSCEAGCHGFEVRVDDLCFKFPLPGEFQLDNLATAITLFESAQAIGWARSRVSIAGASQAYWPARLEFIPGLPPYLLDAAHNSLAFQHLLKHIKQYYSTSKIALVFGASEMDKVEEGLHILSPVADAIFLTSGFYRSAINAPDEVPLPSSVAAKTTFFQTPLEAQEALKTQSHCFDLAVVTGSIFLVGAWKEILRVDTTHNMELKYS